MRKHFQTPWWLYLLPLLAVTASCAQKEAEKPPLTPAQLRGQRLYGATCAVCHRADSTTPLSGPGLKGIFDKKFLNSGAPANDERVTEVIHTGRRGMRGYSDTFSDAQIADLVAYLHSL